MPEPFEDAITNWAAAQRLKADRTLRNVAREIGRRVIARSPIDTGQFVSNWYFSLAAPDETRTSRTNIRAVNNDAARSALKAGDIFFIQNNLPYARRLEFGYSNQAPLGIARLTALEFQSIVKLAATQGEAGRIAIGGGIG